MPITGSELDRLLKLPVGIKKKTVVVQNVPKDMSPADVTLIFSPHGEINRQAVKNEWVLIEYSKPQMAIAASESENSRLFRGHILVVQRAFTLEGPADIVDHNAPPVLKTAVPVTKSPPPIEREKERLPPSFERTRKRRSRSRSRSPSKLRRRKEVDDRDWRRRSRTPPHPRRRSPAHARTRSRSPTTLNEFHDADFRTRNPAMHHYGDERGQRNPREEVRMEVPSQVQHSEPAMDVIVVASDNSLLNYARSLERRIRTQGLMCFIDIIPPDKSAVDALEYWSNQGVMFVAIVDSQNEVHFSVTLHIIFGDLQEHRNMPVDDAMQLIKEVGTRLLKDQYCSLALPSRDVTSIRLSTVFTPRPVGYLACLLADSRYLSVEELTTLVNHIEAKRQKLAEAENKILPPLSVMLPHDGKQPVNLHAQILSMLSKNPVSTSSPTPTTTTTPSIVAPAAPPVSVSSLSAAIAAAKNLAAGGPKPEPATPATTIPASVPASGNLLSRVDMSNPIIQRALSSFMSSKAPGPPAGSPSVALPNAAASTPAYPSTPHYPDPGVEQPVPGYHTSTVGYDQQWTGPPAGYGGPSQPGYTPRPQGYGGYPPGVRPPPVRPNFSSAISGAAAKYRARALNAGGFQHPGGPQGGGAGRGRGGNRYFANASYAGGESSGNPNYQYQGNWNNTSNYDDQTGNSYNDQSGNNYNDQSSSYNDNGSNGNNGFSNKADAVDKAIARQSAAVVKSAPPPKPKPVNKNDPLNPINFADDM